MNQVFVAGGANIDNRYQSLSQAERLLMSSFRLKHIERSGIYETDPIGGPEQGLFLNLVWSFEVDCSAGEVLSNLLSIEEEMGRERTVKNGPRNIDLDLLFFNQEIIQEEELIVPHPRLHKRLFVLEPLNDIAPEWIHPQMNATMQELLRNAIEENYISPTATK